MEYTKPFLTYEEQAYKLIDKRGMIADRADLIHHLEDVGYYRLSGYWHIYNIAAQRKASRSLSIFKRNMVISMICRLTGSL